MFSKEIFVSKFYVASCNHYISPLSTFIRKGKDLEPKPEPDPHPDAYLLLTDPDPGGPKTYGSVLLEGLNLYIYR
jgi:hypothetical protein